MICRNYVYIAPGIRSVDLVNRRLWNGPSVLLFIPYAPSDPKSGHCLLKDRSTMGLEQQGKRERSRPNVPQLAPGREEGQTSDAEGRLLFAGMRDTAGSGGERMIGQGAI